MEVFMSQEHVEKHHTNYVAVWGVLLVLLAISLIGPELGNKWVTIITAFGIAIIKAYIVASKFLHLNLEKRYIWYLFITGFLVLGVLYAGLAPDIMMEKGQNWSHVPFKDYFPKE
ncbi:MAG: caa(3)-type oxidase subunit IV [bacterium]|jgi:caa(3)-type oxidase subunit IV